MTKVDILSLLAAAPSGSTGPDSISVGGGFIWVAYTNGADSTGLSGSSTVVQYDNAGNLLHSYTVAGYVDGLKYNPFTGKVWVLQNQDGNSTLSLIDPVTNSIGAALSYAPSSATQGYDDVVFTANKVFLSYTNPPGTSGDAVVVSLDQGNSPSGTLTVSTVLTDSMTGTNTVTGQPNQPVPETDPDSLKLAPNGDLIFSSGGDGTIIDIANPGAPGQSVSFTDIQGVTAGNAGLDDVIRPVVSSGTFVIADTKDNRVLSVHVSGLNTGDYYASVGSLNAFGQVDPATGAFTSLVSAANAPGFTFGSPHGVEFIPDTMPCFAKGTRIATPGGDAAVESLSAGDTVVTADGRAAAVRWVGHRTVDCRAHPRPKNVLPVRIAANAFGEGMPHRDLLLSPDHAVYAEDVLIPIKYLIDDVSIRQAQSFGRITYFHIELDRHDIVLAEGLPAESYLETGGRTMFENGGAPVRLHPDFSQRVWEALGCAPLVVSGPQVTAVLGRLAAIASAAPIRHAPEICEPARRHR